MQTTAVWEEVGVLNVGVYLWSDGCLSLTETGKKVGPESSLGGRGSRGVHKKTDKRTRQIGGGESGLQRPCLRRSPPKDRDLSVTVRVRDPTK